MKYLALVTGGRGGSDFFLGLLDNHKQILQIPGVLRINSEFLNIFNSKNNKEIANKFIDYVPLIFDSRKNKIERHNKLGKNKNEYYLVNKKKFIKFFITLSSKNTNKKTYSKIKILENLYKAYYLASNKRINNLKIMLLHTHTVELTNKLFELENIKKCSIIHTMRHPINAICSPIYNWLKYKKGIFFHAKDLYFQYDLAINGLYDLIKTKKKVYVVLLENLIKKRKIVMKDFCKIFKIKYSKTMLECTYFGKQWWGDEISGRWIGKNSQENKISSNEIISETCNDDDIFYFRYLTQRIAFKYFNQKFKNKKKYFYLKILPTKSETLVWKNTLKHKKLKDFLSIPLFYLKRIFLLRRPFKNKINLPYSIGYK